MAQLFKNNKDLNNQPFKTRMNQISDWDSRGKSDYHRIGDYCPWTIAKRVCNKFIGKNFDKAFARYCELVPAYQQKFFFEQFNDLNHTWRDFYLDKNNCIRKVKSKKNKTSTKRYLYTHDYKTERKWFKGDTEVWWGTKGAIEKIIVVSGTRYEFDANDPEYRRVRAELEDARRKEYRESLKERKNKCYSFLSKAELKEIEDLKNDIIKRDAHGFDNESFKGEEYHGQKRKKVA